jgi:methylenetetrahydrofolate dehydrogenase (NADP+)/methenyltetrahydrofolate cyclohydrolase
MQLLSGKEVSQKIKEEVKEEVIQLRNKGIIPTLATVLVGKDPASMVYVGQKHKTCQACGINSKGIELPEDTSQDKLLNLIDELNQDNSVHGILVQLPLPSHIDSLKVLSRIAIHKDVDGFHPFNTGLFFQEKSYTDILKKEILLPCTPSGIIELLKRYNIEIEGKHAVILGRSNIVGKPLALLLLACDATVTICHTKTKNLKELTSSADILVAAVGKAKLVKADFVKEGAIVVDVGITRTEEGLVGDVDFDAVKDKVSFITPVPGGVGPMTVAMLLKNTIKAVKQSLKRNKD